MSGPVLAQAAPPAGTAPFGTGTATPPALPGADPLAQLRDIRLPDPVSFWPPAPGWWMLAGLIGLLLVVVAALEWRRRQTLSYRLGRTWQRMAGDVTRYPDPRALAAEGALLIRRVVVTSGRPAQASLTGAQWEAFLASGKAGLPAEIGAFIARAPYLPPAAPTPDGLSREALAQAVHRWLRGNA